MRLLEVKNLKMYYMLRGKNVRAVDGVSFDLDRGQALGILGESGCGKTSLAFSIMGLLPANGRIIGGHVFLNGEDLTKLPPNELRQIRWSKIAMIFQSAMNSLDPVYKVGNQLIEVIKVHEKISRDRAKKRVADSFKLVGLPASRADSYPHELSGGMKQRVIIAMSLLLHPELLLADEPTTALDVIVQNQILQKIKELQQSLGISMIIISHDVSIVTETCEKIAIMYGGKIIEFGDLLSVFENPRHPYTIGLFQSFPSIHGPIKRLVSIRGTPPNLMNPPIGCRFEPRCPMASEICKKRQPPEIEVEKEHYSYCHFAQDLELERIKF